ncbi:hypothetical protein RXR98_29685 [Pseudomonas aeruginosa]|nr:hypothetical protein [Pseudomonas aeruginosa]
MKRTSRKFRLFQYSDCCVQARRVIDLSAAMCRGLVETNGRGICRVSDDLIELGNYTEIGHIRVNGDIVRDYFR